MTSVTNFLLHYQGKNDLELQKKYGALIHRITGAKYPQYTNEKPIRIRANDEKIKVGFISSFIHGHSIIKTHGRWITGLDKRNFEISTFYTGTAPDRSTAEVKRQSDHFFHRPHFDSALVELIESRGLDAIIYPDIGMDPISQVLGAMRLAPVQCNGLGHPVTSGLPAIDYALSAELMEPPDGDSHYLETLIRLPNIASCYELERILRQKPDVKKEQDGKVRYLCSQSLYKLLPQNDEVYPRIAREVRNCQFWFIAHRSAHVTDIFKSRLAGAFAKHDLDGANFFTVHPRQNQKAFLALNRKADVLLDSIMWSGNNSTLEGIACDLPVVTLPGPMMRGRHTYAILKMMGIEETIAEDLDDYVRIAVRLGNEPSWREAVVAAFASRRARVYDDEAPVRALERFLEGLFRPGNDGGGHARADNGDGAIRPKT